MTEFKKQVICKEPIKDRVDLPEDLEEWSDLLGDKGILKKLVAKGRGTAHPPPKSYCTIKYVLHVLNTGEKIDTRKFQFQLNMGAIDGWDVGVPTMLQGEKCILRVRYDYAYGERGSGANIPSHGTLLYEIELLRWEEDMTDFEKPRQFELFKKKKLEGNECFKNGRWSKAKKRYDRVQWYFNKYQVNEWKVDENLKITEDLILQAKLLEVSIWCNISAIYFKQKKYKECIKECTKCLKFYKQKEYRDEGKNMRLKLLYRRSICHRTLFDWKLTEKDIRTALLIDEENKTFLKLLDILEEKKNEQLIKEKNTFIGMFNKWEGMLEQEEKEQSEEKRIIQENERKNKLFLERKKRMEERRRKLEEEGNEESDSDMMSSSTTESEEEEKKDTWIEEEEEIKEGEEDVKE